jgi:hypothetical protein
VWGASVTVGQFIHPASFVTALNHWAYLPRPTSGTSFLRASIVALGLIGAGLVLSPVAGATIGVPWTFILLFRNNPAFTPDS